MCEWNELGAPKEKACASTTQANCCLIKMLQQSIYIYVVFLFKKTYILGGLKPCYLVKVLLLNKLYENTIYGTLFSS